MRLCIGVPVGGLIAPMINNLVVIFTLILKPIFVCFKSKFMAFKIDIFLYLLYICFVLSSIFFLKENQYF